MLMYNLAYEAATGTVRGSAVEGDWAFLGDDLADAITNLLERTKKGAKVLLSSVVMPYDRGDLKPLKMADLESMTHVLNSTGRACFDYFHPMKEYHNTGAGL